MLDRVAEGARGLKETGTVVTMVMEAEPEPENDLVGEERGQRKRRQPQRWTVPMMPPPSLSSIKRSQCRLMSTHIQCTFGACTRQFARRTGEAKAIFWHNVIAARNGGIFQNQCKMVSLSTLRVMPTSSPNCDSPHTL
jgi:hypothetical protein